MEALEKGLMIRRKGSNYRQPESEPHEVRSLYTQTRNRILGVLQVLQSARDVVAKANERFIEYESEEAKERRK